MPSLIRDAPPDTTTALRIFSMWLMELGRKARIYRSGAFQGSTTGTFRSWKCRVFRVAIVARMSTGRPAFCRGAAKDAASVAAALSLSLASTHFTQLHLTTLRTCKL